MAPNMQPPQKKFKKEKSNSIEVLHKISHNKNSNLYKLPWPMHLVDLQYTMLWTEEVIDVLATTIYIVSA